MDNFETFQWSVSAALAWWFLATKDDGWLRMLALANAILASVSVVGFIINAVAK